MKLQTQISLKNAEVQIGYNGQVLLLGSCFAENMGEKLDYFKFQLLQNPLGILFHPLAIENLITKAIQKEEYSETDVFFVNERWHCFDAHSSLSDTSKENLITNLNAAITATRSRLEAASHVIMTLGTAWAYRHTESNNVVANCHKVPQKDFNKELLSIETITESLKRTLAQVRSVNTNASCTFTISPVRHLKDGFVENQRSKAHLIAAVQEVVEGDSSLEQGIDYFPAYELMIDELRDYRFYKADMVHPSTLAIDYIWEKFKQGYMSNETSMIMQKVGEIQKGLLHRPFDPDSGQHQKFLDALDVKMKAVQKKYPFMVF